MTKHGDRISPKTLTIDAQDQYSLESYWKILMTPNNWLTPGVQVVFDPAFIPDEDVIVIPHVKFQIFF